MPVTSERPYSREEISSKNKVAAEVCLWNESHLHTRLFYVTLVDDGAQVRLVTQTDPRTRLLQLSPCSGAPHSPHPERCTVLSVSLLQPISVFKRQRNEMLFISCLWVDFIFSIFSL